MFNKKTFLAMVNAYESNSMVLDLIASSMNTFGNYVAAVYRMEVQMPVLRFRLEADDFRDAVQEMDRARRNAHEAAIASCSILNRVCGKAGVDPLFTGDIENREEVGEFCISAVDTMFGDRSRGRMTIEEMVAAAKQ